MPRISTLDPAIFIGHSAIDAPAHATPMAGGFARLGFPSPADDFIEDGIDLHRLIVVNEPATYLWRVKGESMREFGILHDDIVAVDRSLPVTDGKFVLASWEDYQPTVKQLKLLKDRIVLRAGSREDDIVIPPGTELYAYALRGLVRLF